MNYKMEPILEEIDRVGPRIRALAEGAGFSPEDSLLLELAAIEALTNIVEHGGILPGQKVEIDIMAVPGLMEIRIEDPGRPIPEDLLGSAGPESFGHGLQDPMSLPESGMGLSMIMTIMDKVEYSPGCPNVLLMTKQRMKPE